VQGRGEGKSAECKIQAAPGVDPGLASNTSTILSSTRKIQGLIQPYRARPTLGLAGTEVTEGLQQTVVVLGPSGRSGGCCTVHPTEESAPRTLDMA
jgi:hypothetical protein